jgi:hypothetical protein
VRRSFFVLACVLTVTGAARGAPYWDTWEGNNYPEMSFWQRTVQGGGAARTLEDGVMVLDGTASPDIADDYWKGGLPILQPGEVFKASWRLRVDDVQFGPDPIVAFATPSANGNVQFRYWENRVCFPLEDWAWVPIAPGVFHEYSLVSTDMSTYKLYVDGQLAHVGQFLLYSDLSGLLWGDGTTGAASASTWDYVRYGILNGYTLATSIDTRPSSNANGAVVPEPSTWMLLGPFGLAVSLARVRRRWSESHENIKVGLGWRGRWGPWHAWRCDRQGR